MTCGDCSRADRAACGACGGSLRSVVCLGDQPLANGLLDGPGAECGRYPLHVSVCADCRAVQLLTQVEPDAMFASRYPYFSSQSMTMLGNARDIARRMIAERTLSTADLVVEVGSNDGYLLRWYAEEGVQVLGVDPADEPAAEAERQGVPTDVAFFGEDHAEALAGRAAVVHANNVIAHVPDPVGLFRSVRAVLDPEGVFVMETPWVGALIDEVQFDTIYHEHRWYWSATALRHALLMADLHVHKIEWVPVHGGSLRVFAGPRPAEWPVFVEQWFALEAQRDLGPFAERVADRIRDLGVWFDQLGRSVAGYGAAAKATMMHSQIGTPEFVVDSTPAKVGRFTPLGVPIFPVEALVGSMPEHCVIGAWNFAAEVTAKSGVYLARGGNLWTTTPRPRRMARENDALST